MKVGVHLASRCSNCGNSFETLQHVFFQFPCALIVWSWLSNKVKVNLVRDSLSDLLHIVVQHWEGDLHQMVICIIIRSIWHIWLLRNNSKHNGTCLSPHALLACIAGSITLSRNMRLCMIHSWHDKSILHDFDIKTSMATQGFPKKRSGTLLWIVL
ncbi:hypothetical protein Fmac_028229 [Flemingia macrophylla]|uniref:Reverse transcriptase zinc-binding domain-containing protein n=1 Tax=Flemingia macrophylla TaxID=520843 RepID=A0ABD1L6W8_9FABA